MDPDLAALIYRYGGVTGRGAPEGTPIIDLRYYVDLVPILGFHDQVRPYLFDARLAERGLGASHVIWNGLPAGQRRRPVAHEWAEAIDAGYEVGDDRGRGGGRSRAGRGSRRLRRAAVVHRPPAARAARSAAGRRALRAGVRRWRPARPLGSPPAGPPPRT